MVIKSNALCLNLSSLVNNILMNQTIGNPVRRILAASLIGTTIEFFDFYIYATTAVLVFPKLFFPAAILLQPHLLRWPLLL
jgi:hypothetical protein